MIHEFPDVVASAADAYAQRHSPTRRPRSAWPRARLLTPTEESCGGDLGSPREAREKHVLEGAFDLEGRLPVNPEGGLKSSGITVAGQRVAHCGSECWRSRGEGGERQLDNPTLGLTITSAEAGRVCVIRVGCRQGIECSMNTSLRITGASPPGSGARVDLTTTRRSSPWWRLADLLLHLGVSSGTRERCQGQRLRGQASARSR